MEFKPNKRGYTNGTHLQGYVRNVSFPELCNAFGPPHRGPEMDKSTAEWVFENVITGEVFTLYDYEGGDSLHPPVGDYDWHVGGMVRANEFVAWVNGVLWAN